MSGTDNIALLKLSLYKSFENNTLIKAVLSKKRSQASDLNNVFIRPVVIKGTAMLSFVYRHATNDVTRNLSSGQASNEIDRLLTEHFLNADIFTSEADFTLLGNKRGSTRLLKKPPVSTEIPLLSHDKVKRRLIQPENNTYLRDLGVLNARFEVRNNMQDKYKQINKYVEIIDGILNNADFKDKLSVVDMGSGKGYLTFALYDYLKDIKSENIRVTGVEVRPDLVEKCNKIAEEAGFKGLKFTEGTIENAILPAFNMLIALHACDTATDEAIYRGISARAPVIVCARHAAINKSGGR